MIKVENLGKRYGDKWVVDHISFTVGEGEIVGFLGPNGAGKTTTMSMITGFLSSTEGTVQIGGINVLEDPIGAKKQIGYLPEIPPLYMEMTVREYLNFIYDLKGCTLKRDEHLKEIAETVRVADVYNRVIRNLSKGYRQRVGIAQALVGNPKVIIFEESYGNTFNPYSARGAGGLRQNNNYKQRKDCCGRAYRRNIKGVQYEQKAVCQGMRTAEGSPRGNKGYSGRFVCRGARKPRSRFDIISDRIGAGNRCQKIACPYR